MKKIVLSSLTCIALFIFSFCISDITKSFGAPCEECCNISIDNPDQFVCQGAGSSNCSWLIERAETACCATNVGGNCENIFSLGSFTLEYRLTTGSSVTCKWLCDDGKTSGTGCAGDIAIPISGSCTAVGETIMTSITFYDCGGGSIFCINT